MMNILKALFQISNPRQDGAGDKKQMPKREPRGWFSKPIELTEIDFKDSERPKSQKEKKDVIKPPVEKVKTAEMVKAPIANRSEMLVDQSSKLYTIMPPKERVEKLLTDAETVSQSADGIKLSFIENAIHFLYYFDECSASENADTKSQQDVQELLQKKDQLMDQLCELLRNDEFATMLKDLSENNKRNLGVVMFCELNYRSMISASDANKMLDIFYTYVVISKQYSDVSHTEMSKLFSSFIIKNVRSSKLPVADAKATMEKIKEIEKDKSGKFLKQFNQERSTDHLFSKKFAEA